MADNQIVKSNTTTDLAKDNAAVAAMFEQKARKYLSLVGQNLSEGTITPFLELCKELELNPFKREVYAVPYTNAKTKTTTLSIITGYSVYIKRAERIGKMDGWHCEDNGKIEDWSYSVTLVINRKDWKYPFKHTVYFAEVCQRKYDGSLNDVWAKQPRFMTKKVAIAQGFRLCFPDEMGGMPYTSDEIPQGEIQTKVINDGNGNVYEIAETEMANAAALSDIRNEILSLTQTRQISEKCNERISNVFNNPNASRDTLMTVLKYMKELPPKPSK